MKALQGNPRGALHLKLRLLENHMDIGKIEYRVRPVTRYIVTRFEQSGDASSGGSSAAGEYDNPEMAYEVGYALCKAEHDRLGLPVGDERIQYPTRPGSECRPVKK